MKKVSEYLQHANECRAMARTSRVPEHKAQLESMAKAWETLAEGRRAQLNRRGIPEDQDAGQDFPER